MSPTEVQGPKHLGHLVQLSQAISKEPDWKWSSLGTNGCHTGCVTTPQHLPLS